MERGGSCEAAITRGCAEVFANGQLACAVSLARLRKKTAYFFKRSALKITDTELKLIASAAIMGDSSHPVNGYRTPAAIGTPMPL
ncbi:hypothetical protein COAQ111491_15450 [Comamonas aquatilis]